jgi:thioredoxin-like negative regulator of GroEL
MFGRTYLAPGEDPELGVRILEHAFDVLPSVWTIRISLAEAYVATNRLRKARQVLLSSEAAHADGEVDQSIEERIAEIRERRQKQAERAKKAASSATGAAKSGERPPDE